MDNLNKFEYRNSDFPCLDNAVLNIRAYLGFVIRSYDLTQLDLLNIIV